MTPKPGPVIWMGTQGTVWRSLGSGRTSNRPVGVSKGSGADSNAANLLETEPVRRTTAATGLHGTGGRSSNMKESFAPYKEQVFEGAASKLGIPVGSGKKYDGAGETETGPPLTGKLLTAFRLSFNPNHVGGKKGGVALAGGGSVAGTSTIRTNSGASDERFNRGSTLLHKVPVVEDWTRIAEAEGASGELLLSDLAMIRSILPEARSAGFVNEYALGAWVMRVTRNVSPIPKRR